MAYSVGMGITGEKHKDNMCITDANGPVAFQRCSRKYILPNETEDYDTETGGYIHTKNMQGDEICQMYSQTPSSLNPLCRKFYGPINELR